MRYIRAGYKIYHPRTGQIGLQVKNGNNRVISFDWYDTEEQYNKAVEAMGHQMTSSLLQWHLARDNQAKLHTFCAKHKTESETTKYLGEFDGHKTFNMTFKFDNGGFITAEMLQGVNISDHFQVVDYGLGN